MATSRLLSATRTGLRRCTAKTASDALSLVSRKVFLTEMPRASKGFSRRKHGGKRKAAVTETAPADADDASEPEHEPHPEPEPEPVPEPEPKPLPPFLASARAEPYPRDVLFVLQDLVSAVEEDASGNRQRRFERDAWKVATAAEACFSRGTDSDPNPQPFWSHFMEAIEDLKCFFPDRVFKICAECREPLMECDCMQKCPCGCGDYVTVRPWMPVIHCDKQWRVDNIADFIGAKPIPATIDAADLVYRQMHGHPFGDEAGPMSPGLLAHRPASVRVGGSAKKLRHFQD